MFRKHGLNLFVVNVANTDVDANCKFMHQMCASTLIPRALICIRPLESELKVMATITGNQTRVKAGGNSGKLNLGRADPKEIR